ncbi:MAG: DoxX family protein [Candidatus Acidiferrales bacterium]
MNDYAASGKKPWGLVVLLGRICFAIVFILGTIGHFNGQDLPYAVQAGVPLAKILVPLAGVIAIVGGLSILFGYKAKIGGWLIVLFLIPVTLMMHNFWAASGAMRAMQLTNFYKNLSMLGGAFLISQFGAGPWSLDALAASKRSTSAPASAATAAR